MCPQPFIAITLHVHPADSETREGSRGISFPGTGGTMLCRNAARERPFECDCVGETDLDLHGLDSLVGAPLVLIAHRCYTPAQKSGKIRLHHPRRHSGTRAFANALPRYADYLAQPVARCGTMFWDVVLGDRLRWRRSRIRHGARRGS